MPKSFCQTSAETIDKALSNTYKRLKESQYELKYDSLAPLFKRQLIGYLTSSLTLNNTLDSLETLITIRQSSDKKIKFYSWDELTGGTWHEINVFAQYKGIGNKILYQQLDTDKEVEDGRFTDSEIYEVNEIREGQKAYYLTFSWGTHGSGKHHELIQVFKIEGDVLVKCRAFNQEATEFAIEYPRSEKLNLKFDKMSNSISFDEFSKSQEQQFAQKTGKRKTLKFSNGSFR